MEANIKFIGLIHTTLTRLEDCPLQESEGAPEGVIEIYPAYFEALKDLREGDNIIVLTWLHQADRTVVSCKPRNNPGAPQTGVFSTRSPDRPNPIGVHTVGIISISDTGMINISAIEVLDQTPVIDIKPVW